MAKKPACTQCGGRLSALPGETGKLRCESCGKVFKVAAKAGGTPAPSPAAALPPLAAPLVAPLFDLQPLGNVLTPLASPADLMPLEASPLAPMPPSLMPIGTPGLANAQNLFGPDPYPFLGPEPSAAPPNKTLGMGLKVLAAVLGILIVAVPLGIIKAVLQHQAKEQARQAEANVVSPPGVAPPTTVAASGSGDASATLTKLRDNALLANILEREEVFRNLQEMPIDEARREEIARELLKIAQSSDFLLSESAQKCLPRWTTPAQVNELAAVAATSRHLFVRNDLLEAIPGLNPNTQTAAILAPLLAQPGSPQALPKIFEKIGPSSEPAVLALLKPGQPYYNDDIYQVLQTIGTEASEKRLKEIADDPQVVSSGRARTTAMLIESRLGKPGQ